MPVTLQAPVVPKRAAVHFVPPRACGRTTKLSFSHIIQHLLRSVLARACATPIGERLLFRRGGRAICNTAIHCAPCAAVWCVSMCIADDYNRAVSACISVVCRWQCARCVPIAPSIDDFMAAAANFDATAICRRAQHASIAKCTRSRGERHRTAVSIALPCHCSRFGSYSQTLSQLAARPGASRDATWSRDACVGAALTRCGLLAGAMAQRLSKSPFFSPADNSAACHVAVDE